MAVKITWKLEHFFKQLGDSKNNDDYNNNNVHGNVIVYSNNKINKTELNRIHTTGGDITSGADVCHNCSMAVNKHHSKKINLSRTQLLIHSN
jgi:hypothetical protein